MLFLVTTAYIVHLDSLIIARPNTTRRQLKTAGSQFSFLSVTQHRNKKKKRKCWTRFRRIRTFSRFTI